MILVNNPGNWEHIYPPLEHASWHGLTPTDLVFPFFLFAVGNAMALTMPKLEAAGASTFWKKIIKSTILIFLIGLFLNWWPFVRWQSDSLNFKHWVDPVSPENGIRILGVLQRIAICYFLASVILYYFKAKQSLYITLTLLVVYWILCVIGNPADPYSLSGWFGTDVDKKILGVAHMYKGEGVAFDPEGIMSTIPSTVEVIFGYLIGNYIHRKGKNFEMVSSLFVAGVVMLIAGFCWDMVFPINKKIWTSSFTIYTSGLATITIATMIYVIELKNIKGWLTRFFDVFGKNALFVFALSAFLPRLLGLIRIPLNSHSNGEDKIVYTNPWNWLYQKVLVHIPGDPRLGSLVYALCVITFMWAICWWLDRRKIYIKV